MNYENYESPSVTYRLPHFRHYCHQRTFVAPLEVLTHHPAATARVLAEAAAPLLRGSSETLVVRAMRNIHANMQHSRQEKGGRHHRRLSSTALASATTTDGPLELRRRLYGGCQKHQKSLGLPLASELLHSEVASSLERYFARYRALWPLFVPSEKYLRGNALLQVPAEAALESPPWWPTWFEELPNQRWPVFGPGRAKDGVMVARGAEESQYADDAEAEAADVVQWLEKMLPTKNVRAMKEAVLQAERILKATGHDEKQSGNGASGSAVLEQLRRVANQGRAVLPSLAKDKLRAALDHPKRNVDMVRYALADATDEIFGIVDGAGEAMEGAQAMVAEAHAVLPALAEKRLRFAVSHRSNAPRHLRQAVAVARREKVSNTTLLNEAVALLVHLGQGTKLQ
jgi:hypothetical protein